MILRINFCILSLILKFSLFENVSGFNCEMKNKYEQNFACNVKSDSYNNTEQVNYEDKDVLSIKFNATLLNNSNLTLSQFPFCERFENLRTIKIIGDKKKYLDENFLHYCKQLKEFEVKGINLKEIPESFFIKNPKLETIIMNDLNIEIMPENMFLNQSNLLVLQFFKNKIAFLPPNIFKKHSNLQFLDLSYNLLRTLNPAWFSSLQNLHKLGLSYNKIEDLPKNIFKQLKNLNSLLLTDNFIKVIHSDSFGTHLKLKNLYLYSNKINAVDKKFFDNITFEEIKFRNNICFNGNIGRRDVITEKLQKCFSNYETRQDECKLHNKLLQERSQKGLDPLL